MMKYLLLLVVAVAARGQYGAATSVVSGNGAPIAAQCTNANNVGRVWARKDGGAINSTFYVCSSTGGSSFGWELVGSGSTPSGGAVGGASSVASGRVLYGTGAGVAGSNTNFRYFVGTGNLLLGTTTDDGTNRLQVAGSIFATGNVIGGNLFDVRSSSGESSDLRLTQVGIAEYRIRNVAASGTLAFINSAGTNVGEVTQGGVWQFFNQTPTTGATQLIVRAGAGQSSTNLTTWQNAAGTQVAGLTTAANVRFSMDNGTRSASISALHFVLNNLGMVQFGSTTDGINPSVDAAFARNTGGVIEVNNGTAGSFRDLYLRGVRPVGSTVANLPTASGNTGMLATVTDATVTTIGTTVAGGGGNTVLVWSNGTNWRIYAN
ncbi:MAG: hypothetical protein ACK52K_18035 [Alphaproteobacteria bacterium]